MVPILEELKEVAAGAIRATESCSHAWGQLSVQPTSPKSRVTATGFGDTVSAQNAIGELIISLLGLTLCFQKCPVMEHDETFTEQVSKLSVPR